MNHADEHNRKMIEEMVKQAHDAQDFENFKTAVLVILCFLAAVLLLCK